MATLYDTDFYSWTRTQAAGLRRLAEQRLNAAPDLDWLELADEVEQLSRSLERELYARYVVLLTHLLKWQFQPGFRCGSWQLTITGQRRSCKAVARNRGEDSWRPSSRMPTSRARAGDERNGFARTFPSACHTRPQASRPHWPGGEQGVARRRRHLPGSNCDRDLAVAMEQCYGGRSARLAKETEPARRPDRRAGGFAYGDNCERAIAARRR